MVTFTNIVNYASLAMAVWLGIYLVTRSSHSQITWLSALTLWSMAGVFLNTLLAMNPPPTYIVWPTWTHLLLPFWRPDIHFWDRTEWLQGWLVVPAIAFWHHATLLMLPGKMTMWRWARLILIYGVALAAILVLIFTPWMFEKVSGDPLSLDTFDPGPIFPAFVISFIVISGMCLANLIRTARRVPLPITINQILILITATSLAGIMSLFAMISLLFDVNLPSVVLSIMLGCSVFLIGFGVARYSALSQGRTLRRDFLYNLTAIGLITIIYMAITWFSVQLYLVPAIAYVFVLILVIVSHSLIDFGRRSLDLLFFRKNVRNLRANLRVISRIAIENSSRLEDFNNMLASICTSINATYALLVLFAEGKAKVEASCGWNGRDISLKHSELCSDDIRLLPTGHFAEPLSETAILIPLYIDKAQIGALLIGRPTNGVEYTEAEIDMLYYPCDQLAYSIHENQQRNEYFRKIENLAHYSPSIHMPDNEGVSIIEVETCLRNLYDFAYLGASPLSRLAAVNQFVPAGHVTHLDNGKAAHSLLVQAIDKLRPELQDPRGQPSREWYPYLILHMAYIEDKCNRDIMSRLYISEGTFNRTRRSAIRAVTRALNEMEAAAN